MSFFGLLMANGGNRTFCNNGIMKNTKTWLPRVAKECLQSDKGDNTEYTNYKSHSLS